jgi:hypothetical protein
VAAEKQRKTMMKRKKMTMKRKKKEPTLPWTCC